MVKVLICDDQDFAREGLQLILETDPELQVVGVAQDGADAIEKVDQLQPDLVLMDLKMPGINGIQATQAIHDKHPEIFVLVLTTYDGDAWVFDAIRSGASGYLLKDSPRDRLIAAIKETVQGKTHVDPGVAGKLLTHIAHTRVATDTTLAKSLSDREKDVLKLLAHGLTNTEIAQQLYLSEGTVKNYVSSLFTKLDVADRTQAAVKALRYGLVNLNDL
ncbi:response regulator transcription factor [Phototrophicus methaneseepsis]|uniref:Response regulator transcription factor n=2 Tax=Phototrophicus methaneseepsis TaxID=2710758 RepID=A0A7S8EE09_9CHLR|nr:response regulator transcription factor [Phototrophicus methaneseepsis]